MDTDAVLDLLRRVADEVIVPRFRALSQAQVIEKNPGDLVTVADREAEAIITRELSRAYPDAVVLGEEASHTDPGLLRAFRRAEHAFTVDPLDGTKNFVAGSPDHAVMVAQCRSGEVVRAWIWQPAHQTSWVAERGAGTRRNGQSVTIPDRAGPAPPRGATARWALRGQQLGDLPPLTGSWVCCGVDYPHLVHRDTDYLLYGPPNPWDHCPGTLLVTEAGGALATPEGSGYQPRRPATGLLVAADPDTAGRVARLAAGSVWPA